MDIISEILETDRLAEQKLEEAKEKRSSMLLECELEAAEIREDAKNKVEEYRRKKLEESGAGTQDSQLKESGKAQLKALNDAYDNNHEKWENDIVAAITG
ncbi:hypothetical protein [uncultured Ruminococcus sp.]|uniref:hypothetical protein n=1 Tax=uncultured Ruminococcus sp. TaxID=165186 RepID=UPI000EB8E7DD|nr:hypothetical protein [uncultured Ruminococcus sp.]HCJ40443.1 hypothetical protein [Ruminococcus sp.]